MMKKYTLIVSFTGLFLISVGISLIVFYFMSSKNISATSNSVNKKSRFNLSLPKVAECPLNGMMYTKPESEVWETRRPVLAMIENSLDSRPQSGLSKADVVYEAVAEGGITRFMAVFYCGAVAQTVKAAPIRSARIYYVNFAAGYGENPIYLHQGGANNFCPSCPGGVKPRGEIDKTVDAYAALDKLGWRNGTKGNDMDGGFNIGYPVVVRDQYRLSKEPAAWEHSVVADLDEVYKEAEKRGFGSATIIKKWLFQDGKALATKTATNIKFGFWDNKGDYDVEWQYDSTSNLYKRINGGKPHTDWEFDKPQLTASNVVIMFTVEKGPVDTEKHMFYQNIGTGKALIFQNGEAITGTWVKKTQLDKEVFYGDNGDEIKLVRGPVWIEVLPAGNSVSY